MEFREPSFTTQEKAEAYESVCDLFEHLFAELKALGSKKPSETLSASKVTFINRLLKDILDIMESEPEHKYLDLLDDETLPQYSDAILILSQYEAALKGFKGRHFGYQSNLGEQAWYIEP